MVAILSGVQAARVARRGFHDESVGSHPLLDRMSVRFQALGPAKPMAASGRRPALSQTTRIALFQLSACLRLTHRPFAKQRSTIIKRLYSGEGGTAEFDDPLSSVRSLVSGAIRRRARRLCADICPVKRIERSRHEVLNEFINVTRF
ncbi:hypothetical protein ParKJ_13495 [Paraburkholderia fungorum]|uniref:Uncharacterized protein n=1 Tax=Paraburkholderia fungorum TaxID=134537 RepID=A0AAP5QA49_9BURK|nr:hypothetical protein [Paraburkholderia fungorum]MDT8838429.1 hypothetical protein [Paraburkholderia fungorum]